MIKLLSTRLLFLAAFFSPMPAQTSPHATVAVITNDEGAHTDQYFTGLAESAETEAVFLADTSGKTVAAARKILGLKLKATYSSTSELFARHKPTVVLISLESKLGAEAINASLDAGAHVITEKPATLSIAEFAPLAKKAADKKLLLMFGLTNRLNPLVQHARGLIRENKIGKIYGTELHLVADQTRLGVPAYHQTWFAHKSRAGGGHLIWLGIHWIDLAMYLTDSPITQVSGFIANVGGQPLDVEDSAVLSLKFANGSLGTMTSGYYTDKGYHSHIKIWGSQGWIEINLHGGETPFRYYSTVDGNPEVKTYVAPANAPAGGYTTFVARSVRAALGLEAPPVSNDDSVRIIQTMFTAYAAAETGRTQQIPQRLK